MKTPPLSPLESKDSGGVLFCSKVKANRICPEPTSNKVSKEEATTSYVVVFIEPTQGAVISSKPALKTRPVHGLSNRG